MQMFLLLNNNTLLVYVLHNYLLYSNVRVRCEDPARDTWRRMLHRSCVLSRAGRRDWLAPRTQITAMLVPDTFSRAGRFTVPWARPPCWHSRRAHEEGSSAASTGEAARPPT